MPLSGFGQVYAEASNLMKTLTIKMSEFRSEAKIILK